MDDQFSIKNILEEIQKSKNELVNTIEASEIRIRYEIEGQNNKIRELLKENIELKNKVEKLEAENRKNNIMVFGLNKSRDTSIQQICQEIGQLTGVEVKEEEVNNIHYLSQGNNPPLKIELTTYLKKRNILRNYKLRGTNISIAHDLSVIQREENKTLRYFLKREREANKDTRCFIRGNKLVIGDREYTAEELNSIEDTEEEGGRRAASAPSTPVQVSERRVEDREIDTEKKQVVDCEDNKTGKNKYNKGENPKLQGDNTPKLQTTGINKKNISNSNQNRVLRSLSVTSQNQNLHGKTKK